MKKKIMKSIIGSFLAVSMLVGCSSTNNNANNGSGTPTNKEQIQIGMVTDMGSIDDRSFNQLTWEGIQRASEEFGLKSKYLKPEGVSETELMKEITNLYDANYRFIVTPGFKFATPIYEAQKKYPDTKFVIIDSEVYSSNNEKEVAPNTVSILFNESEAGFLAGVAAAVQVTEGNVGFIGGMETDAVQRFNWGYQQGIDYANKNLGTKVNMNTQDFIYQGTFTDSAAGQQIAAQMYDRGVSVIFSAAGGVGNGVIKEAKERALAGSTVWVIGVDADQYNTGIYKDNLSIILTSALKNVGEAAYEMIKLNQEGNFPGGQTIYYGVSNNGVGLPVENPNLSEKAIKAVDEVYKKLGDGEITVQTTGEGLIK